MVSKSGASKKTYSLFENHDNRENFSLLIKLLSEPSKGLCLCQVQPRERLKILEFLNEDSIKQRVHTIDMVNPLRGPKELQQSIVSLNEGFGQEKDIFFIYNFEVCINLLETSAEEFFQGMNLIRDFFMGFDAMFVFFLTPTSVKTMIRNAVDLYDWMTFTFVFAKERIDVPHRPGVIGDTDREKYSASLEKIQYLERALENVKNEKARAIRILELGQLYSQVSLYEEALEKFEEALEIEKKFGDSNSKAILYHEIGLLHETAGDQDAALTNFNSALENYNERGDGDNIEKVTALIDKIKQLKKNKNIPKVSSRPPGSTLNDAFDWDELLLRIRQKRIIPVIGHGLYRVDIEEEGKTSVLLYDYLADKICEEFGFTIAQDEHHRIAKASAHHLRKYNNDYFALSEFLDEKMSSVKLIPGNSLWKLARIKAFNIFLTTAYDDLLTKTINAVRNHPAPVSGYSVYQKEKDWLNYNLLKATQKSKSSLVYHIFGNMDYNFRPAYAEKDILELLLDFYVKLKVAKENYFFNLLHIRNFLFMGCGYEDWFYRFFIRIISNESYELTSRKPFSHNYIADDLNFGNKDTSRQLIDFMGDYGLRVYHTVDANSFVDLLFDKLATTYPEEIIQPSDFPAIAFISFAGQDRKAAKRLAENLSQDGIDVWWDEKSLESGAPVDLTIKKAIEKSPVFIPMLSKNSKSMFTPDGALKYHIQEWEYARAKYRDGKIIKIMPVVIDGTDWKHEGFARLRHVRIPDGKKGKEYEELLKALKKIQENLKA